MPTSDRLIGNQIIHLAHVDSTNNYAYRLAVEGAPEGVLVLADEQSAGRGRRGKNWYSTPGLGLWFSCILRPNLPASMATVFPFFASVALIQSIKTFFPLNPQVKWPNDLLVNQKKLAGILSEVTFEMQQIKFIILGIGINVNQSAADFPENIRERAISLAQAIGTPLDTHDFLNQVRFDLDRYYQMLKQRGFGPIRSLWKANCPDLGRLIEIRQAHTLFKGIFQDLAPDGSLILQQSDGTKIRITSGEF